MKIVSKYTLIIFTSLIGISILIFMCSGPKDKPAVTLEKVPYVDWSKYDIFHRDRIAEVINDAPIVGSDNIFCLSEILLVFIEGDNLPS